MRRTRAWLIVLAALGPVTRARAHEGPPFPIVMDRRAGPYVVSVWTDPDVGVGKFFVILEPAPGTTLPQDIEVKVCVRPQSGRLPEACSTAQRQQMKRVQFYAEVEFDRQEMWGVRVTLNSSAGAVEVTAEVEATPPGYGRWDLLCYGFPFMLFGLLWLCVALRRRRERANRAAELPPDPAPVRGGEGEERPAAAS
jgi:hypothetical protein